jgi:hypothetical protein
MATTSILPALPSGLGSTVVQANALILQANDYVPVSWSRAQQFVKDNGGGTVYAGFPVATKEDTTISFYMRGDLATAEAPKVTLAMVKSAANAMSKSPTGGTTSIKSTRITVSISLWHWVDVTLTDGSKFSDVLRSDAGMTVLRDPETNAIMIPTNGYQQLHETTSFIMKPVAAGAPVYDPLYAAVVGLNPNR